MSIFVSLSYNNPRAAGEYLFISQIHFQFIFCLSLSGQQYVFLFRGVYKDNWNYLFREMKWVNLLRQYTHYYDQLWGSKTFNEFSTQIHING